MKTNRIRWLIPLFLFFGILFCCSLTAYAVPKAPTSVSVTVKNGNTVVTKTARGTKLSLTAQATGGSGTSASYEYSFSYKVGSNQWAVIKNFSQATTATLTLSEAGTYTIRVNARVKDSSGVSQSVTRDTTITSVGVSNTSIISSSAISLGESVTINASATGGTHYEYYYSVSTDGGSHYAPIQPSSSSAQYVASASCSYKPKTKGDYLIRVFVRDKDTGASDQKVFSLSVAEANLTNLCDVSSSNIEISHKGAGVTLTFKADKGSGSYQYRCSYTIAGTSNSETYIYGDSNSFASGKTSIQHIFDQIGTYKFKFEVQDKADTTKTYTTVKSVDVRTNLTNTSGISSNTISNKAKLDFYCSATGGTSEYEYKLMYQFEHESEKDLTAYDTSSSLSADIPALLTKAKKDADFTGKITFTVYVRDRNIKVVREKKFEVDITVPSADPITRQQLMDLLNRIDNWEMSLSYDQRNTLNIKHKDYLLSKQAAQNAVNSDIMQDYGTYFWDLQSKWNWLAFAGVIDDEFWMTKEVNNASAFETSLLGKIETWFTDFSKENVSTATFSFDINAFVNQFSQIFVIFASSLLVILFGVNVIKTAFEYQLFTLKGAVSVFGRLILAEIWIQLSTKICLMIYNIFNELMTSILSAMHTAGVFRNLTISFKAERSGVWLIGDIVDFFANLCPFLLIIFLIGVTLAIFIVVYIKLIIRTLEIAMMTVISPVFFACSVGEASMPYFKKFISSFLAIGAEIIFMSLVYLAFMWYCHSMAGNDSIMLADLYDISKPAAGKFYTYIAVTVACGIMMIRPPQVLRELMR